MYKVSLKALILLISISIYSCDGNKSEDANPSSGLNSCNDVDPIVNLQEKGDDLSLNGYIWAEVLQNVHHIDVISALPVSGSIDGDTLNYYVSSANPDGVHDDKSVWRLPFSVNQLSTDYKLTVVYYCNPKDEEGNQGGTTGGDTGGGEDEPSVSFEAEYFYNPGNLCDPGGESLFIWDDRILINDTEDVASITGQTFNVKWPTRPPHSFDADEGFLLLYPIEEIESASLEMVNIFGENKLSKQFNLQWFITNKPIDQGGASFDIAYLSANINISDLLLGLSQEELDNYRSITFTIKYCGGKEYKSTWQLDL